LYSEQCFTKTSAGREGCDGRGSSLLSRQVSVQPLLGMPPWLGEPLCCMDMGAVGHADTNRQLDDETHQWISKHSASRNISEDQVLAFTMFLSRTGLAQQRLKCELM
jgi:hypothetical protein